MFCFFYIIKQFFKFSYLMLFLSFFCIYHQRSYGDISIHQRCINSLLTEVYKYIHGLSPEIMNEVFSTRANIYNTQQFNVFETHIPTSNRYGLNSIPYKASQLWDLLPENVKSSPSLTLFKIK